MHPINNTSLFKSFIYKRSTPVIIIAFLAFYFILSFIFSGIYSLIVDSPSVSILSIMKFSILTSFNFSIDEITTNNEVFIVVKFIHRIFALLLSTIFTAAVVLKFFYLPTFFTFKKKCNYLENENKLIITLYNSVDIFVTNCNVRVYCRKEIIEEDGTKSLINISNEPILTKTYPFMDPYLVTRLRIQLEENDELWKLIKGKNFEGEKLDIIILIEANASKIDSSVYEVKQYSIDPKNIKKTVDSYEPGSIDLDYNDFSKSKGWEKFDK